MAVLVCITLLTVSIDLIRGENNFGTVISVGFLLLSIVIIWSLRRGAMLGIALLIGVLIIINALSFTPESYIQPTVIHVLFILPAIITALFIRPLLGFVAAIAQALTLAVALAIQGVATPEIIAFFLPALTNLVGVIAPIVIGARVFHSTIHHLAKTNQQLDARVAERTNELQRVMGLREQDITAAVHDINNRMTVVRAEIDELLLDSSDAGVAPQVVAVADQRISSALNSVSALVDDLRTAVLLDNQALQLRLGPLSLPNLARKVVAQLSTQATLTQCVLSLDLPDHLPLIAGDEHKIERVLINLVGNALKYTRQMPVGQRVVQVQLAASQGSVLTTIADTGPGLDASALAMLGQPFARFSSSRGTEGMGLGVYISRGIVEHHGGWMRYASDGPGRGTSVDVWLPAYASGSG